MSVLPCCLNFTRWSFIHEDPSFLISVTLRLMTRRKMFQKYFWSFRWCWIYTANIVLVYRQLNEDWKIWKVIWWKLKKALSLFFLLKFLSSSGLLSFSPSLRCLICSSPHNRFIFDSSGSTRTSIFASSPATNWSNSCKWSWLSVSCFSFDGIGEICWTHEWAKKRVRSNNTNSRAIANFDVKKIKEVHHEPSS